MSPRRILIFILLALSVVAAAGFFLLRSRPTPAPPVRNEPSAEPSRGAEASPPSAPGPVDLGAALDLARLADCSRSPALASVLEQMVRVDPRTFESRRGGPIGVPGYDRPLIPTFERTRETGGNRDIREVTADLDLPGRWHGLAVAGLRRSFYEESDVSSFEIRFAEPPERVRETLIRHGFRLAPVGALRDAGDEPGISVAIGVDRIEGGAALICTTG